MFLQELCAALLKYRFTGSTENPHISSLTTDSRKVCKGSLFIAIRGYTVDGHAFLQQAVENGAVAALVETPNTTLPIPQIVVPDTRKASAILANVFYRMPSSNLSVIGVTGTNGKTTVTHLIEKILQDHGAKVGLLGTIGKRIANHTVEVPNTTPEAVELQGFLAEMVAAGCEYGVMEVSSHALEEGRVAGVRFHIGVFTNLTQDHLDFHLTMDNYRRAKGKLFSRLGNAYGRTRQEMAYAVLNADTPECREYQNETVMESLTYGMDESADVRATAVRITAEGAEFHVCTSFAGTAKVKLQLTGRFNIYNALAAISVGLIEGVALSDIAQSLESVTGIPGRFQRVDAGQAFTVLVDYAHTPDSLENALSTVKEFAQGRIITVVGCGGDRDKTKRPLMAKVACAFSDLTILTSDNPRTEDPERILDEMVAGVAQWPHRYQRVPDRKEAIEQAIAIAKPDDVILIAGKGHEDYQILGRTKIHFDDREVARDAIRSRS